MELQITARGDVQIWAISHLAQNTKLIAIFKKAKSDINLQEKMREATTQEAAIEIAKAAEFTLPRENT